MTLSLDPTKFTEGQKRAVASLQQTARQLQTQAQGMQRSGTSIVSVFEGIQHPIAALHRTFQQLTVATSRSAPLQKNLSDIAVQGRRSGAGIQSGALAGASGLRILGVAGLGAFAAITALNKAMQGATENAGTTFAAGVRGAAAGMNIRGFTAISQALFQRANVPQEETQNWLAEITQWQQRLRLTGQGAERMVPLAQTGAGIAGLTDTPEQMLRKFATTFHGLSEQEAIARGGLAGLSPALSLSLRSAGGRFPALVEAERRRSTTDAQAKSAGDLLKGSNNLIVAWDNMSRIIYTELNPAFEKLYNTLTDIIEFFSVGPGAKAKRDAVAEAAVNALPGGPLINLGRRAWNWFKGGAAPAPPSGSTPPGASSPTPGIGHTAPRAERAAFIREYAASKGLNPDAVLATAGGEGLNVYTGDAGTSFGDFQLHVGGGMGDQALAAGVDIRNPNKWKEQDRFAIDQMAVNRDKGAGWFAGQWHGAPAWAAHSFATSSAPSLAQTLNRSKLPPGVRLNSKGEMISQDLFYNLPGQRIGAAGVVTDINTFKAASARVEAQRASIMHDYGGVTTGDINVHTQATDPRGIGQAVVGAIKGMVPQAKTGLD